MVRAHGRHQGPAGPDNQAAEVSIEELIEQLQEALADGATHVVGLSGNYRGAQYVRIGRVQIEGLEDEDY